MSDVEDQVRDLQDFRVEAAGKFGRQEQVFSDITTRLVDMSHDVKDGFRQLHSKIDEMVDEKHEDEKKTALAFQELGQRVDAVKGAQAASTRKKRKIVTWVVGTVTAAFLAILGAALAHGK